MRPQSLKEHPCLKMPLGVYIVLWFVCALFIAILGFGLYDAYTNKGDVDIAWPVVTLGLLWMVYDIRGRHK